MKKNITINESITINGCTLIAAGNFNGTICEYLIKKLNSEEKEQLENIGNTFSSNEGWAVLRLVDGEYNDDSWYVGWDTAGRAVSYVWNELSDAGLDEVPYPYDDEEVETYLKENEYFFSLDAMFED